MVTKTISNAGGNWNATTTWTGGVVPLAADDVVATGTSGQVTINTTTCVCKSIDLTGYTNTLTFTAAQTLSVSGNVNFTTGVGGALAGTGNLLLLVGGNLTSAGKTFPGNIYFGAAVTWTLQDNWTITGSCTIQTGQATINGNQISVNTNLTLTATSCGGTTKFVMSGTGIWSGSTNVSILYNDLEVNTAGTITMTNAYYGAGYSAGVANNLTLTTGTVAGAVILRGGTGYTGISTAAGKTWAGITCSTYINPPNIQLANNLTCGAFTVSSAAIFVVNSFTTTCTSLTFNASNAGMTITGDFDVNGTLTVNTANAYISGAAYKVYLSGALTLTGFSLSGTSTIILDGTTTWAGSSTTAIVKNNLEINTAGTITFGTTAYYNTGTITYTTGTLSGTLVIYGNTTIVQAAGHNWGNINIGTTATVTILADLTITGTLTMTGATTWSGAFNIITIGLTFNGAVTNTLSGDIDCSGTMTVQTGAAVCNGHQINLAGNLTLTAQPISGNTNLILDGTTTWTSSTAAAIMKLNTEINTAGTITMTSAYFANNTITLTTGTISGTLSIYGNSTITNAGGKSWAGITIAATSTLTMSNALTLVGSLILSGATTFSGAYDITCTALIFNVAGTHTLSGNINCNGTLTVQTGASICNGVGKNINVTGSLTLTAQPLSGTANVILNGTGTWSASTAVGIMGINTEINTAGTITISGTVYYGSATIAPILKWTAGTITMAGTLDLRGSCTFTGWNGTATQRLNALLFTTAGTYTLSNTITLKAGITFTGAVTFSGAYDINCTTLLFNAGVTHTLSGDIYASGLITTNTATSTALGIGHTIYSSGGITSSGSFYLVGNINVKITAGTMNGGLGTNVEIAGNLGWQGLVLGNATYAPLVKYTSGTITWTSLILTLSGSCSLDGWNTSGAKPQAITFSGTSTYTMLNRIDAAYTIQFGGASTFVGAYDIHCNEIIGANGTVTISGDIYVVSGNITLTTGTVTLNGAHNIYCQGTTTSNIGGNNASAIYGTATIVISSLLAQFYCPTAIGINIVINTAGSVTWLGPTIKYGSDTYNPTLTYTAGTIAFSGGNVITINGSCHLNGWNGGAGTRLNCITISSSTSTITLDTDLILDGILRAGNSTVTGNNTLTCLTCTFPNGVVMNFAGTTNLTVNGTTNIEAGNSTTGLDNVGTFTTNDFSMPSGARFYFPNGETMNVTNSFYITGLPSAVATTWLYSKTGADWYLNYTGLIANIQLVNCTIENVDASTIAFKVYDYNGVVNSCLNIYAVAYADIVIGGQAPSAGVTIVCF